MTIPLSIAAAIIEETSNSRKIVAAPAMVESIYDVPEGPREKSFTPRPNRSSSITEYFHAAEGAFTEGHYNEF